ncbi:MAG: aminomethyl-transferring glycine dehydrogenase [Planctomycetes bacterium]|nr:aminomethyl-transferring glycine dehydrogenase [Planctomycetota bacterium]
MHVTPTRFQEERFEARHIGPDDAEVKAMLKVLGYGSLGELSSAAVPNEIQLGRELAIPAGKSERAALAEVSALAAANPVWRSFLGLGYHDTVTPAVLVRNILENPGWYTQYTPYQPEISQGRLEALLNFQTMIIDLTGLEIANSSMLDEGTAAAEAMGLAFEVAKDKTVQSFFVAADCHPQTIDVVRQRALPLGIEIVVGDPLTFDFAAQRVFGALVQYPNTDGIVCDFKDFCERAHAAGALVTVAADLLSLCLLESPGQFGADIAVGNTQRFGVPLGYGGPHAAYFATKNAYKRGLPGRLVGVSIDKQGKRALRLALQTREQHIRREKATSNICTAQVLLAVIAGAYGTYHGPNGLRQIAGRVHHLTATLAEGLRREQKRVRPGVFFDTLRIDLGAADLQRVRAAADLKRINLRVYADGLGVALAETTTAADVADLLSVFTSKKFDVATVEALGGETAAQNFGALGRKTPFMEHPVFNTHHSESEMMRYLQRLASRDLSLTTSMIPLGSCTMKLNAAAEMLPITFPGFGKIHPFAPTTQTAGYQKLFADLEIWLAEITGFHAVSLQPNAGSAGEYAGLQVIRAYHQERGDTQRNVCLIPRSAHGTNPASAVMAGMKVVVVECDDDGNIDMPDLRAKIDAHKNELAALMITYPSTHGVFEATIKEICKLIHQSGGQVYMDGANMNAQVGLTRPGDIGADVCHLNLHKTFCIPHGGGGPGMGPICVAKQLAPYLPGNPLIKTGGQNAIGAISSAPWGSASILPISWMYIAMMGGAGLKKATQVAILNANYIAKRLAPHYPILYTGAHDLVAHECIIDCRPLKAAGVEVEDVAKRLMDYGFHAPTMSWPVAGTLMIEPTESESLAELDRFCDALIAIRREIARVESGELDRADNPLKNAPHTMEMVCADAWAHPYSREEAAFPAPWTRAHKFWPASARIDNAYGDRNLVCACLPMEAYA